MSNANLSLVLANQSHFEIRYYTADGAKARVGIVRVQHSYRRGGLRQTVR